jgi:hypothetical protein
LATEIVKPDVADALALPLADIDGTQPCEVVPAEQ